MAIESVKVKALADMPFSPDGTETVQKRAGDVFLCPLDVAIGLKASGLVEDAGEEAEVTPRPKVTAEKAVVSPAVEGVAQVQEVDPQVQAELAAARTEQVLTEGERNIEPIEHGGLPQHRIATRGVVSDAVAVEDADTAAQIGKASAAAETAQELERPEVQQLAEQAKEQEEKKAELLDQEIKMEQEPPENKAKRGRPRKE